MYNIQERIQTPLSFLQSVCDATSINIPYPGSGQSRQGDIVNTCVNVRLRMVAEK